MSFDNPNVGITEKYMYFNFFDKNFMKAMCLF